MRTNLCAALFVLLSAAFLTSASGPEAKLKLIYSIPLNSPGGAPATLLTTPTGGIYGLSVSATREAGSVIFQIDSSGTYKVVHQFPPLFSAVTLAAAPDGALFGAGGYVEGADRKERFFRFQPDAPDQLAEFPLPPGTTPAALIGPAPQGGFFGIVGTGYQTYSLAHIGAHGEIKELHRFHGAEGIPYSGGTIIRASNGSFYGLAMAQPFGLSPGWLYRISADGVYSKLADLPGFPTGGLPASVLQASDGYLYIALAKGGKFEKGAILRSDLNGNLEPFVDFPDEEIARPAFLMEASDGLLYGSNNNLPSYIFSVDPKTRSLKPVYAMNDEGREGQCPCRLVEGRDGVLYGAAIGGGRTGKGAVFSLNAGLKPSGDAPADHSRIAPDGAAYITRVVPVPATVSIEAQKMLARVVGDNAVPQSLEQRRTGTDKWQAGAGEQSKKMYPVNVAADTIAGVPVRVVTPLEIAPQKRDRVLINLHGGGFNSDSGSLTESIPIANLTGTKVIAVLYRLAPEHPFPAGLDDAVAVYRELLKTYQPSHIGIYGTSAGAILTAETTAKLKQLNLPMPGATGVFSGLGDFSQAGDSMALFALNGFSGHLDPPDKAPHDREYIASTDPKDPVLSPLYGDLSGFPPTLFITSGRDLLLSGTTILHRAYLRAGVDAELVVFEALPHAFWNNPALPESKEADRIMARFFDKHLR